jgi:hypothetical protein
VLDYLLIMPKHWVESLGTHTHTRLPSGKGVSLGMYDRKHRNQDGQWISGRALYSMHGALGSVLSTPRKLPLKKLKTGKHSK